VKRELVLKIWHSRSGKGRNVKSPRVLQSEVRI
jgi:hypothetical protein